jgi:hypothetical protein
MRCTLSLNVNWCQLFNFQKWFKQRLPFAFGEIYECINEELFYTIAVKSVQKEEGSSDRRRKPSLVSPGWIR